MDDDVDEEEEEEDVEEVVVPKLPSMFLSITTLAEEEGGFEGI